MAIRNVDQAHRAIKHGNVTELRTALDESSIRVEEGYFQTGSTLLMLAALHGDTSVGELLLAHGADVNAANKFGGSALENAIMRGHPAFVRLLLSHGASLDRGNGRSIENHVDWAEQHCGVSSKQASHIRDLTQAARKLRTR